MIGRDKITVNYTRDGQAHTETFHGVVVTETINGKAEDFGGRLIFMSVYRVLLPRSFAAVAKEKCLAVSIGDRQMRFETPFTPIYDGRGRVRHYEAIVRSI
ncbi:hypothetical protein ACTWP6_06210 [Mycobacterium sp. 4D054]|uniref:hypothetical protein n=1 Tax=Mycobacterium sp. 4D054 TaxID=3457440 RepID=UPI003FD17420